MNGASGTGTEYVYDSNGSLVQDYNKKIAKIQYNLLNLPSMLQFQNGNTTSYQYSNDGVKRKVTHQTAIANVVIPMGSIQPLSTGQIAYTSTTDYCGNVIYEDGILSKVLTSEGYITLSGTTPTYHYYLKDHLGNNRVVIDQNGSVEQVNHYYPFGGLFGEGTSNTNQAYKYNGKELDRMHGLDWYDYGTRNYDAALPVWTTVDPLAEKYYNSSPYAYCANNPVNRIDPTGMEWKTKEDEEYAQSLSQAMTDRMNSEQKSLDKLNAKIAKNQEKGKDVSKDQTKAAGIQENINNLSSGISELTAMGDTKDQVFTYNKIDGNVGGADIQNGVIVMDIASNGSKSNGIHESSHGYDYPFLSMPYQDRNYYDYQPTDHSQPSIDNV